MSAHRLGIGAPFGALAADCFHELCSLGQSEVNESAVIEVARMRSP